MDPTFITNAEWSQTGELLRFFFGTLLFVIGFAANMLLALAFIPSLVGTGHLSRNALNIRPALMGIAFACLGTAAYFFFRMVELRGVLGIIYPTRWWM
ncbi:MAG: hypothetical protein EXR48_04420 [Dehalococcoidia bacterium]|nr:hypothetical protein [Dehalococcoidia bacterium]